MSESNITWIDMTDLSSWKGHFTGIQRVVYNVAKGYHDNTDTKFFTFDPQKEQFYEFDFSNLRALVEARSENGDTANTQAKSKKQAMIKIAKHSYVRLPEPIKSLATPERVKRMASKGYGQYQRVARIKSRAAGLFKPSTGELANFNEGDTVIILGNSWDRPSFLPVLNGIKRKTGIKIFQVIYDLIPIFQPQAFNEELFKTYTKNMFEVVTNSDGLMAISESSKRDVRRFCKELGITAPPIEVIRLGDDIPSSKKPKAPHGVSGEGDFILCVGTIEARKNHTLLYYALKEGIKRGIAMPKLVIVGRRGWYTNDIIHILKSDPEVIDQITILNNVTDDELVWLYANCAFTVYPSYYEGWGLPVAESLAMGKACLTSNVSSMPEVGGDLCVYHSPYNSAECLEGIIELMDEKKRERFEEKIKANYKLVNWKSTYEQCHKFVSNS